MEFIRCNVPGGGRQYSLLTTSLLVLFLLIVLSACGDVTSSGQSAGKNAGLEETTTGGSLYVANVADGSLLVFDPSVALQAPAKIKFAPLVSEGNILPSRRFPDAVDGSTGIFLDRTSDTLYVASPSLNAIFIYENASTQTPPVAPTRAISGNKTKLRQPFGLTYNPTTGQLFVANKDANSILVFNTVCTATGTLSGNIAPCSLLIGEKTQLDLPRDLAIDVPKDILYISNMGNDSILAYAAASSLGGPTEACITTFTPCNISPNRVIAPHTGVDDFSKLELPFGIFIDSVNNRLFVSNTGTNFPGIFIYENASTRNSGVGEIKINVVPERVISGSPTSVSITQLTVPTGIDVDVEAGRIFIVNNNSPNNINQSSGNNIDSPSLIVFDNIDARCPLGSPQPCNIAPDQRTGGDGTLSSPIGIAIDPDRNITYVANTGANNIVVFSVDGDIAPVKVNAGLETLTGLTQPSAFFYDVDLDRLYIANAGVNGFSSNPITVYDQVSNQQFSNSSFSWGIESGSNFESPKGVYVDKTRGRLLVLNASPSSTRHGLFVYDLRTGFTNGGAPIDFPLNDVSGPTGKLLSPPFHIKKIDAGLTPGGPTAMAVDEGRNKIYVADKGNNSVVVYDLVTFAQIRRITGLNQPYGLSIDTTMDVLYVANNGESPAATNNPASSNTIFVFDNASNITTGDSTVDCLNDIALACTATTPDRVLSTDSFANGDQDKLSAPIALVSDSAGDRLFLINSGQNALFTYNDASTLNGEVRPDGNLSGPETLLDFTPPKGQTQFTGALAITGSKTFFVGQPEDPGCVQKNTPSFQCAQGALLVFGVKGGAKPSATWSGSGAVFAGPSAIAIDTEKGRLYVTNKQDNTLSTLPNATQIDVTSPSVEKKDIANLHLNAPEGLFVDSVQDRLYLVNSGTTGCVPGVRPCNAIIVFHSASQLVDGKQPDQIITGLPLNNPQGLAVDLTTERLYVANTGDSSVLVYDNIEALNGDVPPTAIIKGADSQINKPIDVAVDPARGLLYVLDQTDKKVLVFNLPLAGGVSNITPVRVITGSDQLGNNFIVKPSALFLDPARDLLYLADQGVNAVYIFSNASSADGLSDHKTLGGDLTGLNQPSALFVDVTTASP